MTDADGTWNIQEDLHFLFANDNELQNDLETVCEILLDGDTGSTAGEENVVSTVNSNTKSKPNKKGNKDETRYEVRQKKEIIMLRDQVVKLKRQLILKKEEKTKRPLNMTFWEEAAENERIEKNKSIQENDHLKESVNEQATFIEHMEKILRKKPRLTADVHSEAWQCYRLAAQSSLRYAAIHAIADRQLRRMHNQFIQAGIFGASSDTRYARILPHHDHVRFEFVSLITLAAPFRNIGKAAWEVCGNVKKPIPLPEGVTEVVEWIDSRTVYKKNADPLRKSYANTILKRFCEQEREVVIIRTVLEDALMPHMTRGTMENKSGWMEIKEHPHDKRKCRMTLLFQFDIPNMPQPTEVVIEEIKLLAEKFTMAHRSDIPGTFPPGSSTAHIDSSTIPLLNIQSFAERDKLIIETLGDSLNEAIQAYLHNAIECDDIQQLES